MVTHTGRSSVKSDQLFTEASVFKTCMVTHTGERAFICKVCDNLFPFASKQHMVTHAEEKAFGVQCVIKDLQTRAGALKNHMVTHTGETTLK